MIDTVIVIGVRGQILVKLCTPPITAGDNGNDYIELKLDKSWLFNDDDIVLKMLFYIDKNDVTNVAVENNRCVIPPSLLQKEGVIHFALTAVQGEKIIKTSNVADYIIRPGVTTTGLPFVDWQAFVTDVVGAVNRKSPLQISSNADLAEIISAIDNIEDGAQARLSLIEAYNTATELVNEKMFEIDQPLQKINNSMTNSQIASAINAGFSFIARIFGHYTESYLGITNIHGAIYNESEIPITVDASFKQQIDDIHEFIDRLNTQYLAIKEELIKAVNPTIDDEEGGFTFDSADSDIIVGLNALVKDYNEKKDIEDNILKMYYQFFNEDNMENTLDISDKTEWSKEQIVDYFNSLDQAPSLLSEVIISNSQYDMLTDDERSIVRDKNWYLHTVRYRG